jgi:hypothetical protein
MVLSRGRWSCCAVGWLCFLASLVFRSLMFPSLYSCIHFFLLLFRILGSYLARDRVCFSTFFCIFFFPPSFSLFSFLPRTCLRDFVASSLLLAQYLQTYWGFVFHGVVVCPTQCAGCTWWSTECFTAYFIAPGAVATVCLSESIWQAMLLIFLCTFFRDTMPIFVFVL